MSLMGYGETFEKALEDVSAASVTQGTCAVQPDTPDRIPAEPQSCPLSAEAKRAALTGQRPHREESLTRLRVGNIPLPEPRSETCEPVTASCGPALRSREYADVVRRLRVSDRRFFMPVTRGTGSHRMIYHPNIDGRETHSPIPDHGNKTAIPVRLRRNSMAMMCWSISAPSRTNFAPVPSKKSGAAVQGGEAVHLTLDCGFFLLSSNTPGRKRLV